MCSILSIIQEAWNIHSVILSWSPFGSFFQEQSYSSLHSGWSLAWDHFCSDIADPCGIVANPCGVFAISEAVAVVAMPIIARLTKHSKTSWNTFKTLWYIIKHHEPLVKHNETLSDRCEDIGARCRDIGAGCSDIRARVELPAMSAWSSQRLWCWYNSVDV